MNGCPRILLRSRAQTLQLVTATSDLWLDLWVQQSLRDEIWICVWFKKTMVRINPCLCSIGCAQSNKHSGVISQGFVIDIPFICRPELQASMPKRVPFHGYAFCVRKLTGLCPCNYSYTHRFASTETEQTGTAHLNNRKLIAWAGLSITHL